ncbi:hypothetical protein LLEC1_07089 [Akanthomyces lecanii]|uniref:AMP-activated protein kinase glycogen-binding domain-containing protein n=1 Tax=Cordyceps confragosa TaxID=2714763 RepID=A0A179IC26_CORDF|nr:hypothetical protein LLEC1_07089 [Akanthomyces lecanii]
MGSYTFKWEHPAEEVYVTGTFDNWTKSVKLEKRGGIFEKTVSLEIPSDKIYYKFVVDNNWTTNESSPKEADKEGNVNNFLTSELIAASTFSTAAINTVGPGSTTAAMAGQQPLEKDKLVGINPLPASETGVNPISLNPGEKVPQELTAGDIHKHVKLDKESYEKSDTLVGIPNPADVAAAGPNAIPESGLPMPQNATINTVAPGATTAALAGQVPLDVAASKVGEQAAPTFDAAKAAAAEAINNNLPDAAKEKLPDQVKQALGHTAEDVPVEVKESIQAAGKSPEAAASATAVEEKKAVESELLKEVKPAPAAAVSQAKEVLSKQEPAKDVPAEVKESIQEAGKGPEAAANATAVEEKKAVEAELLREVKPAPAADVSKVEVTPAVAAVGSTSKKPTEKLAETVKAPALAAAPVVAPSTAHQVKPAENGAAKIASETSAAKPTETKVTVSKPVTLAPAPQAAGTKPADASVSQTTESKPSDVSAPKVAELPKPTETTPVVSKPAETKPSEKPAAAAQSAANGSRSKPAPTATADRAQTAAEKKKGRLSTFISKIKGKLSDKN